MIHARNCKISGYVFWALSALTLIIFISGSTTDFLGSVFSWIAGIPTWFGQEAWDMSFEAIVDATLLLTIIFGLTSIILFAVSFHLYKKELDKYIDTTEKAKKAIKVLSGATGDKEARRRLKAALKEKARRERIAKKEERRKVKAEMKAKKEALHEARQNRKIAKMQEQINELNKEVKEEKIEKPVVEEVKPEQHEHKNKPEYHDTQKPNNSHSVDSFEDKFNQMFKH